MSEEDPLGFVFAIEEHGKGKREVVKLKTMDNEVINNRQYRRWIVNNNNDGSAMDDKITDAQYDDYSDAWMTEITPSNKQK